MSQSPELEIGSIAPQFRLPGSTGQQIGLADYAGKAHVILFFVREFN
jgi:peroxiredoxin Q/BCP